MEANESLDKVGRIIQDCLAQIAKEQTERSYCPTFDAKKQEEMFGSLNNPNHIFARRGKEISMTLEALVIPLTNSREEDRWINPKDTRARKTIFLGVSGAGKTYAMLRTCRKHFSQYTTLSSKTEEADRYVTQLLNDLNALDKHLDKSMLHEWGIGIIFRWITIKWICLLHLLRTYDDYSPDEFLFSQLNVKSSYYRNCYIRCSSLSSWTETDPLVLQRSWTLVHKKVLNTISTMIGHTQGFGIAFDESQVLSSKCQIFLSAKDNQPRSLLSGVNYAVCELADDYFGFIGFAGTSFILKHEKAFESHVGKLGNTIVVDNFPYFTTDQAWEYLAERLDLSDCRRIPQDVLNKLEGRPRLSSLTIYNIAMAISNKKDISKEELLTQAIKQSFNFHKQTLIEWIEDASKQPVYSEKVKKILTRLAVMMCTDQSAVIEANNTPNKFDLLESGLCHVRKLSNEGHYVYLFQEPLTRAAVSEYLTKCTTVSPEKSVMKEILKILTNPVISEDGETSPFAQLVAAALVQKDIIRKLLTSDECRVYDKNGTVGLIDISRDMMDMQFTSFEHKKNAKKYHAYELLGKKPSGLDLYQALVKKKESGKIFLCDTKMGHDIVGIAHVNGKNFALHASCRFLTNTNHLDTPTKRKGKKRKLEDSDEEDHSKKKMKDEEPKKRRKVIKSKVTKLESDEEEEGGKPKKKKVFQFYPIPNPECTEYRKSFDTIVTRVDKILLLGCLYPNRGKQNQFVSADYLSDKELVIDIDNDNMGVLFQDEEITATITMLLQSQSVGMLENEIKPAYQNQQDRIVYKMDDETLKDDNKIYKRVDEDQKQISVAYLDKNARLQFRTIVLTADDLVTWENVLAAVCCSTNEHVVRLLYEDKAVSLPSDLISFAAYTAEIEQDSYTIENV